MVQTAGECWTGVAVSMGSLVSINSIHILFVGRERSSWLSPLVGSTDVATLSQY